MSAENFLVNVPRYMEAQLAWLQNSTIILNPAHRIVNTRFKNFENEVGQLGQNVDFDLAPRSRVETTLVVSTQSSIQRFQRLSVTQAVQSNSAFNAQEFVLNSIDEYMGRFGEARVKEAATAVEGNILQQFTSSVTITDPQQGNVGQIVDPTSGPYRFFANGWKIGDPVIPVWNDVTQLANSRVAFRNYGASSMNCFCILPDTVEPAIVGNALNQFVIDRNEDYSDGWYVGRQGDCEYFRSNLLPIHEAGTVGNTPQVLTLVSTNEVNGVVTQITASGATPNDPNAIKRGDLIQFDTAQGFFYLQFIGHRLSQQPVQVRVLEDVQADGAGNVVIDIYPNLVSTSASSEQNIPASLLPGRTLGIPPSHLAGGLCSGNPFYVAMPKLPDEIPFPTVHVTDEESGLSMRAYHGSRFGENLHLYVNDLIYGSTLVAENSTRQLFPL